MTHDTPALSLVPRGAGQTPTPEGWEPVYRATVVLVFRYVFARVGNRPDAEDLTTRVYLRALPRLRLAADPADIRSYLLTTARSVLADHWRDHYDARLEPLEDALPAPASNPHHGDEEAGSRRAAAILAGLPEHYRRVLELRFMRGYTVRETAAEMGVSTAYAKVLQHRALRRAAGVHEDTT